MPNKKKIEDKTQCRRWLGVENNPKMTLEEKANYIMEKLKPDYLVIALHLGEKNKVPHFDYFFERSKSAYSFKRLKSVLNKDHLEKAINPASVCRNYVLKLEEHAGKGEVVEQKEIGEVPVQDKEKKQTARSQVVAYARKYIEEHGNAPTVMKVLEDTDISLPINDIEDRVQRTAEKYLPKRRTIETYFISGKSENVNKYIYNNFSSNDIYSVIDYGINGNINYFGYEYHKIIIYERFNTDVYDKYGRLSIEVSINVMINTLQPYRRRLYAGNKKVIPTFETVIFTSPHAYRMCYSYQSQFEKGIYQEWDNLIDNVIEIDDYGKVTHIRKSGKDIEKEIEINEPDIF